MFFLVPYDLIDREDLSIIQKMCILYLARHFDEKGDSVPINEMELAEKLRVSTSEIKLNLEVLLSKGIINIGNKIVDEKKNMLADGDVNDIIVKEAVFKSLNTDSLEELRMKLNNQIRPEEKIREDRIEVGKLEKEKIQSETKEDIIQEEVKIEERIEKEDIIKDRLKFKPESNVEEKAESMESVIDDLAKEAIFSEYDELAAKVSSAEKKIQERASRLKLNVRRRDRRSDSNQSGDGNIKYNRRKTDRIRLAEEAKKESDELLKILSDSNQTLLNEKRSLLDEHPEPLKKSPSQKKLANNSNRRNINPKFMKASSIYKQHESTRVIDESEKGDKEV